MDYNFRMAKPIIICIIPARGGSKGVPLKNIQLLGGKPLLAYSIEQARQCAAIQQVIVTTDHPEVARVARECGARVIDRPEGISGDTATSESALAHVLDHLWENDGLEPDLVVFLQATSPLRQPHDLTNALETFQRLQVDSLFSACTYHGFIWRREDGRLNSLTYDYQHRQRRQDALEDFLENGSIYIFKPWVLRRFNNRLGGKTGVYLMDFYDSFQIDTPADLEFMAQIFAWRQSCYGNSSEA
jgi:CMP-N,N'-diacetyllegionaminic acid synthase